MGLHTLCLLDIKVKEPTLESLAKGKPVYMPPRYMKTDCCAEQLLESATKSDEEPCYDENTQCIGLARIGTSTQRISSGTMKQFLDRDLGEPMHSFVICGTLHDIEEQMYNFFQDK